MNDAWVERVAQHLRFWHDIYFRVTAHHPEHIPAAGAAILAANHSGLLPVDGAMLYADVLAHTHPPRVARAIADRFVPELPFVSTVYARTGVVTGTRANVERLLDDGELLMIFPEGTPGIGKPRAQRYRLQGWRVGHAELGMRHRAPVVPVAIIGAEEQWPQLARIDRFHFFGAPYLPIPATPLPLPVHYHIHYGAPVRLDEMFGDADDPQAVQRAAEHVKGEVQRMLDEGVASRRGVYA